MDDNLMREYIKTQKEEKRRRTSERMGKVLGMFGKALPKGIRHPDSMVANRHLYNPRFKGRTILH